MTRRPVGDPPPQLDGLDDAMRHLTDRAPARCRTPRSASVGTALAAALAATVAGASENLGEVRSTLSEAGLYRLDVQSPVEPISINELHAWRVRVETPEGEPVTGAALTVGGGMPAHSHGLPTAPRVTAEPEPGTYLVEGFRFQMPGRWVVTVDIVDGGTRDSATFELWL